MLYISILVLIGINSVIFSQNDSADVPFRTNDSSNTQLIYNFIARDDKLNFFDSLIYFDDEDSVKSFFRKAGLKSTFNTAAIDFENYSLILVAYRGVDCHSRFDIKLIDDTENKQYIFRVKVIYGGCRAGARRFVRWLMIPKLPEGYGISYYWYYDKD